MKLERYQEETIRTMASLETPLMNQYHMVLGLVTEVGELADQFKKHMAYGKDLDYINVEEELGDILWYISNMCNTLNISIESILDQNIAKLRARFPDKFTEDRANNRDLNKERSILEGTSTVSLLTEDDASDFLLADSDNEH